MHLQMGPPLLSPQYIICNSLKETRPATEGNLTITPEARRTIWTREAEIDQSMKMVRLILALLDRDMTYDQICSYACRSP